MKAIEQVSSVIQKSIPKKEGNPSMFTIPCTIGNAYIPNIMLDLGALFNVLSTDLYETLGLGPLHDTSIVIRLADRSSMYLRGVIKDVMVKVDELVFPVDFYVMDMSNARKDVSILLGRPFFTTAKTKIDVKSGLLTLGDGMK